MKQRTRVCVLASFLLFAIFANAGARVAAEDTFDFTFSRLDVRPRSGALYRLKLAVSPKFLGIFGDEVKQSKVLRFLRTELSLRNPDVAKIVSSVTEFTSEERAKEILSEVQKKHDKVVENAELQVQLAASEEDWKQLVKTQAGLLDLFLVRDERLCELFAFDESQKEALLASIKRTVNETSEVKPSSNGNSLARDQGALREDRLTLMRPVLTSIQLSLLDECLRLADGFREFEAKRMESPNWLLTDSYLQPKSDFTEQKKQAD
ncbi:hypothetical protein [Rhodopirellula europaea]|uniref:hypothetical protein n=1 Tax=Rhodopirellula europaea TaxID=1263866 RepID=UPI003D2BE454